MASGKEAEALAILHEEVAQETGASIGVAVSHCDLYRVSKAVNLPVFGQHVDPIDYGSFTGSVLATNLRASGAEGTLLNHSEKTLSFDDLSHSAACAQKASLMRIICVATPEEVERAVHLEPDFIAYEPPELIGSRSKSVASEKPESIADAVSKASGIPLLVGAGINSPEDIKISLELGASGFLVASAVVKAKDPKKALKSLVSAF